MKKTLAEKWMDEYTTEDGEYNEKFYNEYTILHRLEAPRGGWRCGDEWMLVGDENGEYYGKEIFDDGSSVVMKSDYAYYGTNRDELCMCCALDVGKSEPEDYYCEKCE